MKADPAAPERTESAGEDNGSRRLVYAGCVMAVLFYLGARLSSLGPMALNADIGIQHYLGKLTAEGAIPAIDFEHGWNAASWYLSALFYLLSGGNGTVWVFLWTVVGGHLLAALCVVGIAWRLRLPVAWVVTLLSAWLLLAHTASPKYAIPLLWALIAVPGREGRSERRELTLRAALPAIVLWFHIDLALLMGGGWALYDLFGARSVPMRARLGRVAAVAIGVIAAGGAEVAVYAALGLPPAELIRHLIVDQGQVSDEFHFNYALANPETFQMLVYPFSLALPFIPVIWRRLAEPTRLVAFLHLSQALIAMRRADVGHVLAASTMMVPLAVLAAYDLRRAGLPLSLRSRPGGAATAGWLAVGAAWFAAAVFGGFRIASFAAFIVLVAVCLAAVMASHGGERLWASVGALAAAAALAVWGFGARSIAQVAEDQGSGQAEAIAAAMRDDIDRCLTPAREAWVVPSPLTLYDRLDVTNPTPFYAFWYGFAGEIDRVGAMVEAGEIPVIIQPYGWPESMTEMVPFIEAYYELCAEEIVPETGNLVRVWRHYAAD